MKPQRAGCLSIAGADDNYEEPTNGNTPLCAAAVIARQDSLVRDQLIAGASPNTRTTHQRTPLHGAAELGLEKIVSAMLGTPSTDKDVLDNRGYSPLMLAYSSDHLDTVKALSHAGADLSIRDPDDNYSVLDMAANGGTVSDVAALLDFGADVNTAGGSWSTLHGAAFFDQADCVRVLLDAGADLERKDILGETALHFGARQGSDAALALLRWGADPNQRTSDGSTALTLQPVGITATWTTLLVCF